MSFMVIAVAMLAAFCLQFLFQMVQMKSFNKFYTKLRKKGRVAIGKAKGGFHAGAIVMFAIDQDGVIIDGCFMRGFTMLARFKNWDFFNGIDVGTIKKDDCATIGVSLRRAVLNASSNYNTISRVCLQELETRFTVSIRKKPEMKGELYEYHY